MTITKLGDCTGVCHPMLSGGPVVYQITVPASGIPVGVTVVVYGFHGIGTGQWVSSITDSKGNKYNWRRGFNGPPAMILADSVITTALVSNDKINVNMDRGDAQMVANASWFSSPCYFHRVEENTYPYFASGNAISGGPVTTFEAGEMVMGVFGMYAHVDPSVIPAIATPGAGYTNQPGFGQRAPDI